MIGSLGFSQTTAYNITFEPGSTPGGWNTFENDSNSNLAVDLVANPSTTGSNTSSTVAKFTALDLGADWAGFQCVHGAFGKFNLDASSTTIRVMVYKSVISNVGIKLVTATNGTTFQLLQPNTLINQWELMTFNISSYIGGGDSSNIDQVVVFPDFAARSQDNVCYIDNISFSAFQTVAPPTPVTDPLTAAPTPTRPAANVISMFSNAYTNVTVDTWRTSWSSGTLTDIQIAGNDTKKYSALDFVGIETMATKINASTMTYFHVDAWTPNMTAFRIKLVNFGTPQTESELSFTPTQAGWNSYDIPLSDFTGLTSRSQLGQLIFSGNPTGSGIVFIDNVYFSNVALGVSSFETSNVKMYPNPTSSVFTIEANEVVESVSLYNVLGQEVLTKNPNSNSVTIDIANLQTGVYVVKTMIGGVSATSRIVKK